MKTICILIVTALFASAYAQKEVSFVVKKKQEATLLALEIPASPTMPAVAPPRQLSSQIMFSALGFQLRSGDSVLAKAINADDPFFAGDFSGRQNLSVNSFKMAVTIDGKTETLSSANKYFTVEMKKKLAQLKAGSMIVLKEIKYAATNSSPDDTYAGPFKLFIK